MTWFRVDDGFWGHPKLDGLSHSAIALWTVAGSWCARYLRDGEVPEDRVKKLGFEIIHASELVRAGLWAGVRGGFRFHQWAEYQETKQSVENERNRWRNEKRRQRSAEPLENPKMSGSDSVVESGMESGPVSNVLSIPLPSSPDPKSSSLRSELVAPAGAQASKGKRKPDQAKDALRAEMKTAFTVPPALTGNHASSVAQRMRGMVEAGQAADLPGAAKALLSAAKASGQAWPWSLLYAQPGEPPAPARPSSGRPPRARATTAKDFEDEPDEQEQLRKLGWG